MLRVWLLIGLVAMGTFSGCTVKVGDEDGSYSKRTVSNRSTSTSVTKVTINGCEVDFDPPQKADAKPVSIQERELIRPALDRTWTFEVANANFTKFEVSLRLENPNNAPVLIHGHQARLTGGQCHDKKAGNANPTSLTVNSSGTLVSFVGDGVRSVGNWTLTLKANGGIGYYDVKVDVQY